MAVLGAPFGVVMRLIFELVQNYGLALFLFTVLSRIIMIPLTIKQTKSSAKMAVIQPQIQEINKKYAGNRQKINEESMALYQKVGYSPTAGCLPMLAQMIILFGMIDVILRPLTHILRIPANVLDNANYITAGLEDMGARMMNAIELGTLNALDLGLADYSAAFQYGYEGYLTQIYEFLPQMNFLGVNLMDTPSLSMLGEIFTNFNPVLLIPILSGITSVMLTMATMGQMATPQTPGMPNMKIMMWMMPVFSTVFTFTIHAGVGIYWIFANIVGYVQAKILSKFFNPKEMAEKHRQEMEELKERERQERQERKKRAKERGETEETADTESLSKKEQNRRKLAEARRRDAEKYGDIYNEDDE